MPRTTLDIKRDLTKRDNFSEDQATDLVDAFYGSDDPIVTQSVLEDTLDQKLLRWTITVIVANLAGVATLLALYSFAVG